jgi:EAL domain-containing protein (putative c-di-GMP-specific phosphodiesterase class I)
MIVVAEGVETGEQLGLLEEYGCDLVQGFYLGRPAPAEAVTAMLQQLWVPATAR